MIALVITLTVIVAVLTVLVAGLLRSHASILRLLHELDPDAEGSPGSHDRRAAGAAPVIRTFPGVPAPSPLPDPVAGAPAADLSGTTLAGEAVVVRTTGVDHDTVLVFLSSGCSTCRRFFADLADASEVRLPRGTRLVIVAKDPAEESPGALSPLAPDWCELVMSGQAWTDFRVPGSPYVVAVDGSTGRVKGEGTGLSWEQVARLLAQATGDAGFVAVGGAHAGAAGRPAGDLERERRADRELLSAGILPGDPSLYPGAAPDSPPAGPAPGSAQ